MTEKGLADKARAEASEFSSLSKPAPHSVPLGKSNFLQHQPQGVSGPVARRNSWTIAESEPQDGTPPAPFLGNLFGGVGDTGTEPPDVASAAGPFQIVASANFVINAFDKNGNLQASQDFASFFAPLGDPSTWFLFDPVVQYDPYIGRFWLAVAAQNDSTKQSDLLIAMSRDSDLRFGWTLWSVDMTQDGSNPTNNWCDYPHLGLDTNAIYMTCNQFAFGGNFQYAKIRLMLKNQFLNNTCCQWFDHWNIHDSDNGLSFTIQPAMMRLASGNSGEYLIDAQGEGGSGSTLEVLHIPDPVNNPGELDKSSIGTTGYAPAPSARQPFGAPGIDTGDARLLFATYEFGHLSVGQDSNCGGSSCAAFYEVDVSQFPSLSLVNDWAFQVSGVDYYYPAVDQNFNADKTMVYTRSSANEFAGSNYVGIQNSGFCTLCFNGPETALAAGQNTYNRICCGNRNRWGDYFTASADPDGLGVWISGENVVSQDSWGTEVAATYNGYVPFGQLSSNPLAFGNQAIFSTSAPLAEFVTNTGNATMLLGGISLTGDPNFSVVFNGCSFALLQPGNRCEVDIQFSPSGVGAHNATFTAPYNSSFSAQAAVTGTGIKAATTTTLSSTPNPSTFGQSVKFTAVVVSQTSGTPNGNVTFKDGNKTLGTAPLSGGTAHLTTAALTGGTHSITATYGGSTNYLTSSGSTTQTVKPAATSTGLVSSLNPSTFGKTITFTASISSKVAGTISGTVTFKDGATSLDTVPVSAGKATFATSKLDVGTHPITAHYNGSANFAASTSTVVNEKVNKAKTTTTLKSSANPANHGQPVTFTATVKPEFTGDPTGNVTFFNNGTTVLGTAKVNPSTHQAKITKSTLAVGTHKITAVYGGAHNFLSSASAVLKQVIK
jgi:Bacterial Ig-like domain (group 3)